LETEANEYTPALNPPIVSVVERYALLNEALLTLSKEKSVGVKSEPL